MAILATSLRWLVTSWCAASRSSCSRQRLASMYSCWGSSMGCDSACKKDPLFGVIGIQTGPRHRGPTLVSMVLGSRGWDAGRGDDCKNTPGVFQAGQADQGDLPGAGRFAEGGQEGYSVGGD